MAIKISDITCPDGALPIIGDPIVSISSTNYSILATSGTVLAADTSIRYARLQNVGTSPVYLELGTPAKVRYGIRLEAIGNDGSAYEINESNRYTGIITGISGTSGQTVMIQYG